MPDEAVTSFSFKAVNPLFDNAPFQVCAARAPESDEVRLWAVNEAGVLCVEAIAQLRALDVAL